VITHAIQGTANSKVLNLWSIDVLLSYYSRLAISGRVSYMIRRRFGLCPRNYLILLFRLWSPFGASQCVVLRETESVWLNVVLIQRENLSQESLK
jgi:hypothetical protein